MQRTQIIESSHDKKTSLDLRLADFDSLRNHQGFYYNRNFHFVIPSLWYVSTRRKCPVLRYTWNSIGHVASPRAAPARTVEMPQLLRILSALLLVTGALPAAG